MSEITIFYAVMFGFVILGIIVFIVLFFISAPYGRHTRSGWGPKIPNRWGWLLMEAPASLLFLIYFLIGDNPVNLTAIVFLIIWESHYLHRAFIYPFIMKSRGKMPILIMSFAMIFNLFNTFIQGRWLFHFAPSELYGIEWLWDPRFIIGLGLFVVGYVINRRSDVQLIRLKEESGGEYRIPKGGLYNLISCPNYFGEIILWAGWAILTWSLSGLVFLFWTIANLLPRARTNHLWYRNTFDDYPPERKALFPFIF